MNSPFKMNPGRGPMQKTGRGIPKSMCSPAMQRKDAVSGKVIPENATFGKQKISVNKAGDTTYTIPYTTPGTPGSPGGPKPGQPKMPDSDWIKFKKNETPEEKKERKGREGKKGGKGTYEFTLQATKPAGIKPVASKFETPSLDLSKPTPPPKLETSYDEGTSKTGINKKVKKAVKTATKALGSYIQLPNTGGGNLSNCYSDHMNK